MTEKQRAERILSSLANVNEDLLALLDDVWESIDHRDRAAREAGNVFLNTLDDKIIPAFRELSDEIISLIQQRHGIAEDDTPGNRIGVHTTPADPRFANRRAHSLDEDMTYRSPVGFTMGERAFSGVTAWREVLATVCRQLAEQNPNRAAGLLRNDKFLKKNGTNMFQPIPGKDRHQWRSIMPRGVKPEVYMYVNYSAKYACKWVKELLEEFSVPKSSVKIYLDIEPETTDDEVA